MNKKRMLLIFLPLLAVVLVSAAVVNYLSNTATATVNVGSPMTIAFSEIDGDVDVNGAFTEVVWTYYKLDLSTTGLSTSVIGVYVKNNADIQIENKWLRVNVSNSINDVSCEDITSLMFWDTATPIQIAKGYQELSRVGLCSDEGDNVLYDIPINSLSPDTEYEYPVKITFGLVAPATYTFVAEMINTQ